MEVSHIQSGTQIRYVVDVSLWSPGCNYQEQCIVLNRLSTAPHHNYTHTLFPFVITSGRSVIYVRLSLLNAEGCVQLWACMVLSVWCLSHWPKSSCFSTWRIAVDWAAMWAMWKSFTASASDSIVHLGFWWLSRDRFLKCILGPNVFLE